MASMHGACPSPRTSSTRMANLATGCTAAIDTAQAMLSKKSAELLLLVEAARCACHPRCLLHREKGRSAARRTRLPCECGCPALSEEIHLPRAARQTL